jgi:two-component system, OmpR family, sensor histidine kinase VicK
LQHLSSAFSLPDITSGERTEIVYGDENIEKFSAYGLSMVENRVDVCGNYAIPSVILASKEVKNAYYELNKRGVKIRWITDMTKENISSCKEIMKIAELRHLDDVKGGFVVSDEKVYVATALLQVEKPVKQLIYSNVKALVEQQQYMFNTLWNKAIPAKQRIKEIEEGLKREFIETIRDPQEIQNLGFDLIKSANEEILIIFSTANAFLRQQKAGAIILVAKQAIDHKTKVKILTPINEKVSESIRDLTSLGEKEKIDIEVRNIESPQQTKVTILIADRKFSLAVELKEDSKDNSYEAIGLGIYSNSKPTVLSYVAIFESLWNQSELFEQLKIHDKMQKEFINIAAHELRNPIQPILGLSNIVHSEVTDTRHRELLEVVIRNAKRLKRLTENVLDVTKIESHSLKLNKEQVNLNIIVSEVLKEYRGKIEDKRNQYQQLHQQGLKISYELVQKDDDIIVEADRNRLAQVISNLLSNAIKFSNDDGQGIITITVETKNNNQDVIIGVKDTGPGIDPEDFPNLFTKFFTKSDKGTGLGLFICKSIVEGHGGKIWAENNKDAIGATFSFSLPIVSRG